MVIFLIGVGISEDDGLFAVASFALGVLATAFYAVMGYVLPTLGVEGMTSVFSVFSLRESIQSNLIS